MAKPNYGFEKRQRELAKKKKEEKRLRKTGSNDNQTQEVQPLSNDNQTQEVQPLSIGDDKTIV